MNTVFKMAISFPGSLSYPSMQILRCKFRPLYHACSVANILRGVLGTRVNRDIRVRYVRTGRFDLNTDIYVWKSKFLNPKEKVAD